MLVNFPESSWSWACKQKHISSDSRSVSQPKWLKSHGRVRHSVVSAVTERWSSVWFTAERCKSVQQRSESASGWESEVLRRPWLSAAPEGLAKVCFMFAGWEVTEQLRWREAALWFLLWRNKGRKADEQQKWSHFYRNVPLFLLSEAESESGFWQVSLSEASLQSKIQNVTLEKLKSRE